MKCGKMLLSNLFFNSAGIYALDLSMLSECGVRECQEQFQDQNEVEQLTE